MAQTTTDAGSTGRAATVGKNAPADLAPDLTPLPPEAGPFTAAVEAAPRVVDLASPGSLHAVQKPALWDGTRTRVILGHGVIRDGEWKGEGDAVEFDVAWQAGARRDETTGLMVEGWVGPEASTFVRLAAGGWFMGTAAYAQRNAQQLLVNAERGIDRPNLPDDPRPQGLEALSSDEQRQRIADMLRGGPAEMKRKEAQEARTASDEASDRMTSALEKVLERLAR